MELKINKELIIIYLERYYREKLDFNCDVKINLVTKTEGYYGDKVNGLDMKINGTVNLAGKNVPCIIPITDEEMNNIFKIYLNEQGYEVLNIKNDITTESVYGSCHETEKVFNGIIVKVRKNVNMLYRK